jgi:hypothetical protein
LLSKRKLFLHNKYYLNIVEEEENRKQEEWLYLSRRKKINYRLS